HPGRGQVSVPREVSTFGDLLREFRLAAGLTQLMLSERSGINVRTIQRFEAGRVVPRRSSAVMLAEGLALSDPDRASFARALRPVTRRRSSRTPQRASRTPIRQDGPDNPTPAPAHRTTGIGGEPALVALPQRVPTNVPWPISSLIGRERDVAAITALISEDG